MVSVTRAFLVARISMLEPSGDLFRRPQQPKLVGHDASQVAVLDQLAELGAKRTVPGSIVCFGGPIAR